MWWGADPNTLLTAFHALVTSHLDFGSIFIKPTNQKSLDKLDKVFYEGLRICLGCMKSTPRAALLAEAASTDLEHRRNILSTKFIARKVHIKDHPLIVELLKLRNKLILSPAFHSPLNRPYLISAIYNFFPYITNIYKSSRKKKSIKIISFLYSQMLKKKTGMLVMVLLFRKCNTDFPQNSLTVFLYVRQKS